MASMAEDPAANGKKEEEEFSTGPLSVLMLSVKNNTQGIFFSEKYLRSSYMFLEIVMDLPTFTTLLLSVQRAWAELKCHPYIIEGDQRLPPQAWVLS